MMEQPIEFTLVRHGETVANIAGILQGQVESDLNELGVRQVRAAAEALRSAHFDACYSSDLKRAVDTARIILAEGHDGVEAQAERGLREWDLGELEGRNMAELSRLYPDLMRGFVVDTGEQTAPGGESRSQFQERVRQTLERLAARHHGGEKILLTTHGGTLQMILRCVYGPVAVGTLLPLPVNASISKVCYVPSLGKWRLITWNSSSHLAGIAEHPTLAY